MKWFSLSLDDQKFEVTFRRRANVLYQDFFIAADHAVQQLREEFPGPLYLALSGGVRNVCRHSENIHVQR